MNKKQDIQISIQEINEISFNLNPLAIPIEQIQFGGNLLVGLGFSFEVFQEDEIFKFNTLVQYLLETESEPTLSLETQIIFKIKNLEKVVINKEDEQLQIDDDLLKTLMNISLGTTRGILATNTKGSPLSKFPLPIINPKELLSNLKIQKKSSQKEDLSSESEL
jgi:hypothetical protein